MEGIVDPGEYCREVEAYLCRKNDGHLVRIAGPSFARVCGWAEQGIPLNAVYRGIDRYFERYYSKGARRRPVHIDFCEGDVLAVFDEWRRAVGVAPATPDAPPSRPHASLPAHIDRCIARLTALRAGGRLSAAADALVAAAVRELDVVRAGAAHLRGEARTALLARLGGMDASLLAAIRASMSDADRLDVERQATQDLASFRHAMTPDAYARALEATSTRLLRERTGFPAIAYEE